MNTRVRNRERASREIISRWEPGAPSVAEISRVVVRRRRARARFTFGVEVGEAGDSSGQEINSGT